MTMAQPGTEEVLETQEEENQQEEEITPDPAEELRALKADFAELKASHGKLGPQVGYLIRQFETLQKQPQTPARDERVDVLQQQLEDLLLRNMDSDEKADYLLKKQREPKPAAPAPEPTEDTGWQKEWYDTHYPELLDEAEARGISYEAATRDPDWPKALGDYPNKWVGWKKAARAVFTKLEDAKRPPKPAPRISTERGGGPGESDQAIWNKYGQEGGPFTARIQQAGKNLGYL